MLNSIERFFGVTPDPRISKLAVGSPLKVIGVLTLYALFVKKWGPSFMKNRNKFELRGPLIIYNTLQVAYNMYFFWMGSWVVFKHREAFGRCLRVNLSHHEAVEAAISLGNGFCLLKFFDLLDTVFMVLRKRYHQVTFLHFFHHIIVSAGSTIIFRYAPSGHLDLIGYINSFVHIVMYSYYLLCSLRLNMKNSIWWKKYITLMQILQFVFLFLYIMYPLMNGEECGYPLKLMPFCAIQNVIMIVLFSNFYIKTYVLKTKPKAK